jgi:hypothetical protein
MSCHRCSREGLHLASKTGCSRSASNSEPIPVPVMHTNTPSHPFPPTPPTIPDASFRKRLSLFSVETFHRNTSVEFLPSLQSTPMPIPEHVQLPLLTPTPTPCQPPLLTPTPTPNQPPSMSAAVLRRGSSLQSASAVMTAIRSNTPRNSNPLTPPLSSAPNADSPALSVTSLSSDPVNIVHSCSNQVGGPIMTSSSYTAGNATKSSEGSCIAGSSYTALINRASVELHFDIHSPSYTKHRSSTELAFDVLTGPREYEGILSRHQPPSSHPHAHHTAPSYPTGNSCYPLPGQLLFSVQEQLRGANTPAKNVDERIVMKNQAHSHSDPLTAPTPLHANPSCYTNPTRIASRSSDHAPPIRVPRRLHEDHPSALPFPMALTTHPNPLKAGTYFKGQSSTRDISRVIHERKPG